MNNELVRIHYKNRGNRDLAHAPLTYGVPLPEKALRGGEPLALRLDSGALVPVQTRVLERWFDNSIKWLLLDFSLPAAKNSSGTAALVRQRQRWNHDVLEVRETADAVTVTSPHLSARINRKRFSLFDSYRVHGREMVLPGSDILAENPSGRRFYASGSKKLSVRVIEKGPERVVVESSGRHTAGDGSEFLSFRVRYTFRRNEPGVMLAYKFTNREPPEAGVKAATLQVLIPTALGDDTAKFVRQSNTGKHWFSRVHTVRENVEIIAGGAVNQAAKERYGAAAEGKILIRDLDSFRENLGSYPYYLRPGNARTDMTGGLRAAYPWLGLNGTGGSAVAFFLGMDLNYPKGLRADRHLLTFDIWPSWAEPVQIRRGQSKEHRMFLSLSDRPRTARELEDVYFVYEMGVYGIGSTSGTVSLTLDADYVRSAKVLDVHRWLRFEPAKYTMVELKLGTLGAAGGVGQRGMWDVGDAIGADRSWAHNNENDAILDMIRESYRRTQPGLLDAAVLKAYHNAHVDFIAWDPDPLRQGTMPAHCPEHTDGATYPSHMWADGLMAAYCLTGETDFRDAALAVGENMRRWQKEGVIFYADSRECGWPMLAFLRLHEHTHDPKWLRWAGEVFDHYRRDMTPEAEIRYELPHGVGILVSGYGEFITWRACFFYYERTRRPEVKAFLVRCLDRCYKQDPAGGGVGGWACNDLFPAWAAWALTGKDKYIEDNYPFFRMLMKKPTGFTWGGVDMHYYLNELDRRGALEQFC